MQKNAKYCRLQQIMLRGWKHGNQLQQVMEIAYRQNMKKMDLRNAAGISTNALAKLGKNKNVNTGILEKYASPWTVR